MRKQRYSLECFVDWKTNVPLYLIPLVYCEEDENIDVVQLMEAREAFENVVIPRFE